MHRPPRGDLTDEVEAILVAQTDVDDQDVGLEGEQRSGRRQVRRDADDIDVRLPFEERRRAVTDDGVVIDDPDPDASGPGQRHAPDQSSPMVVPPPGGRRTSMVVPICSARWRMLRSP